MYIYIAKVCLGIVNILMLTDFYVAKFFRSKYFFYAERISC